MVEGIETQVVGKISALGTVRVEPVGRWFEAYGLRRMRKQTLSHQSASSSSSESNESDIGEENVEDEAYIRSLDPAEWRDQDHYKVIGLDKLRYKASQEQIKRSHKKKVLLHHPDKRKARGLPVKEGDDDYFSCITRAFEVLSNAVRRRAYDSVDPTFDDAIPAINQNSKDNFYQVYGPVFEENERWSNKRRIPKLGDESSSFEEVDKFYNFWYNFDSWREYSYLDEEEKEKGENREERRWIEKQNKATRQKRKREETMRIRTLVDNAYTCDPRIQRFREEEKEKKLAHKRAKQEALRQKVEEEERTRKKAEEVERLAKEKEEEEAKAAVRLEQLVKAAVEKREREAQKKLSKKEKKAFRTTMKSFDYFASDDVERVQNMQEVDKLAELLSITSLQELNVALTSGATEKAKSAFLAQVQAVNSQIEKEKQEQLERTRKQASKDGGGSSGKKWSDEELQMLIKAVGLFPAGTVQRWETVANFINQHCNSSFVAKDILAKAKDLQRMDPNMKKAANEKAYEKFERSVAPAASAVKTEEEISARYVSVAEQQIAETGTNPAPWTGDEQKILEQSLKTYPSSTPERWDRIAEAVGSRSKKDCMKRYKELAEMVRAKKAAAAVAATKAAKKS